MDENTLSVSALNDGDQAPQEMDVRLEVLRGVSVLPGGIANLLLQLTRTMKCANAPLEDIATVQKSVCEQFGVHLPDCFMTAIAAKQSEVNNRNVLERIIYDIYCSPGEKVWLKANDMKQEYPELRSYSVNQIGRAAVSLGIPSKCAKGYHSYLLPKRAEVTGRGID